MTNDPGTVVDGNLSYEGGIDSGFPASLLGQNEISWAVNATMRGGYLTPRPGIRRRILNFTSAEVMANFENGRFQGRGPYVSADGTAYLCASISGRIFRINIRDNYLVDDISVPGDLNQADAKHAWFQQAEQWLVVNDAIDAAYLYNGSISRRADPGTEVPAGCGPMAFGKGRLWVARKNEYAGGNLVDSNDPLSPITFTENDYIAEGGAFKVNGAITGMAFAANLDTSLGSGDLLVFTSNNIFAFDAPVDRTMWKNLTYPIQRFAMLKYGSMNHEGIALVNGDVFYRAQDGVRTIQYARRDFQEWGNCPVSRQAVRALVYDTESRLYAASSSTFDNRFLMTIQPQKDSGHGVWHRGLVSLDFYSVSGMGKKLNPAWEGVWTGLRILSVCTLTVDNVDRLYIFALSADDKIELWEVTKLSRFDHDGTDDVRIKWAVETKSYAFGKAPDLKSLLSGSLWFDQLTGDATVVSRFRPDLSECWTNWSQWADCAKYRTCDFNDECQEPVTARAQIRPRIGLPVPPAVGDPQTGGLTTAGYDLQARFDIVGYLRLKRLRIEAHLEDEDLFGELDKVTCVENTEPECRDECPTVACCDLDDYAYTI